MSSSTDRVVGSTRQDITMSEQAERAEQAFGVEMTEQAENLNGDAREHAVVAEQVQQTDRVEQAEKAHGVESTEQTEKDDPREHAAAAAQVQHIDGVEQAGHSNRMKRRIDDASTPGALQLEMEEVDALALENNKKPKLSEGNKTDEGLALSLTREDAHTATMQNSDHQMCIETARAVDSDVTALQESADDRAMAEPLDGEGTAGGHGPTQLAPTTANNGNSRESDFEFFNRLASVNASSQCVGAMNSDEPSTSAALGSSQSPQLDTAAVATDTCTCCEESYPKTTMALLPCSHIYCRRCLNTVFERASVEQSLFPPRCCAQAIPLDDNLDHLTAETVAKFKAKLVEFTTPNRTYCHRQTCSAFVPPSAIADGVGTCVHCNAKTCTTCKGPEHEGGDCPDDPATQEILEIAKRNGWKQCRSCNRIIERNGGCNQISPCFARPSISCPK
ncbi:hypothetical protein O9K51_06876 [Purpureocillium lavendulum]|uniref:RBR-type E3 ubiquitin transferase n=1 Tax=Purpureocillium lavendulum TaxID=1247861 RepID=A0AB34FPK7_9HYPO|nr:hypothetical protein O9K51_06876 [Purpureocillium lavendulum]